jgi:nucleoside-diphosphate-sugar epimerase
VLSCIKNKVKKFIYASSSSVYGISSSKNVTENHVLNPLTDYSKFKADCELILEKYKNYELEWTILRPATVCGFSHRQRFDLVVNILTNHAFNNKKMTVFGGDQLRPNIHIKDMIQAYMLVINSESSHVNFQTFNAGNNNMSVLKIAETVRDQFDTNIPIEVLETNDNRSYHVSSEKIKKSLNFQPVYEIRDAIKDILNAFKENKFKNSLSNEMYFNIKRMQSIQLK